VLENKEFKPNAEFSGPVVLAFNALQPTAVTLLAVVLAVKAKFPIATIPDPVEFVAKALAPTAVLVATAPAPRPTVRPSIEPAPVTVNVLDAVKVVNAPAAGVVAPTVPLMLIEAVPVRLVTTPLEGVPRAGVTKVGEVAKTNDPVPVSSVTAEIRFALDGVARKVATPVPKPLTPVEIGKPVAFVKVTELGVPRAGVTSVGEFDNTTLVVPVLVVTPVPPLATPKVPVMSAVERLTASHEAFVPSV
jgi:hypothetical protein